MIMLGYPVVNVYNKTTERSTMLAMKIGQSTISTGSFSMSQTVSLPEGI